jgi:hypothetical protein
MPGISSESDRRTREQLDRRRKSRGGRRAGERVRRWRRLGWLIAGYTVYVGIRALTDRARGALRRTT